MEAWAPCWQTGAVHHGQYLEAEAMYCQALEQFPESAGSVLIYNKLGILYEKWATPGGPWIVTRKRQGGALTPFTYQRLCCLHLEAGRMSQALDCARRHQGIEKGPHQPSPGDLLLVRLSEAEAEDHPPHAAFPESKVLNPHQLSAKPRKAGVADNLFTSLHKRIIVYAVNSIIISVGVGSRKFFPFYFFSNYGNVLSLHRKGWIELNPMRSIRQLECAIVKGDINRATVLTGKCLREGLHPSLIIEQGILRAMEIVGEKWKTYEYFIPNVLVSAMATKLSLNILQPALITLRSPSAGKAVAGTVRGDVHDIGKNIFLMFMEANGFEVIDLGIDVAPEYFVKTVKKEKPDLLLLSCLYTVTMHSMEDTIIALKKAGLKGSVITLVGGAPVTKEFADSIGADGFGIDAMDGVKKAKELLDGRKGGRKRDGFESRIPLSGTRRGSC